MAAANPGEPGELVVGGTRVEVRDRRGSTTVFSDDPDDSLGALAASWLTDGTGIVVWGEFGPFVVVDASGGERHRLLGHENDPNLGAHGSSRRLATWAADGRVVVWDLDEAVVYQAIDLGGWPEQAMLDATGTVIAVDPATGSWDVYSVASGERIGPTRAVTAVSWHPTDPVLACVDGDELWLEDYRPQS